MSDSDSNDSELNRAIKLSLQGEKATETIDLISDEEDDVCMPTNAGAVRNHDSPPHNKRPQRAQNEARDMVSLKAETAELATLEVIPGLGVRTQNIPGGRKEVEKVQLSPASLTRGPAPPDGAQVSYGGTGLLGLDRKKMEEERINRTRKRKNLAVSPPSLPLLGGAHKNISVLSSAIDLDDSHAGKKQKGSEGNPSSALANLPEDATSLMYPKLLAERKTFMVPRWLAESKPLTLADLRVDQHTGDSMLNNPPDAIAATGVTRSAAVTAHKNQVDLLKPGICFPDGAVRQTWAYGYPRKDDIKIEEVLQKDDLQLAVLSAYQWDEEWILGKINMNKTKVICVVQADTESQKISMGRNVPKNVRFCFPSMAGQINCMHSKLQLLSHPTHLRIVVPSANLVPYDWGEQGGIIGNTVFVIDLPRLPDGQRAQQCELGHFGRELQFFLSAMDMDETVIDSLMNFDYSGTSHLAFIHSIGGSHSGTDWQRTGYCGLGSAVKELGLDTNDNMEIDVVTSSMGNLNINFVKSIYMAATGDNGITEFDWRTSKPSQSKMTGENDDTRVTKWLDHGFRVYFPTRETVAVSKGGIDAAGTICFQQKWYDSPAFPRSILRDCSSQRPKLLLHNKMIFARPHNPLSGSGGGRPCVAWAYVGSANLSEAAWGRLSRDRMKQPKLNIRNWECGVLIPVPGDKPPNVPEGRHKDIRMAGKDLLHSTGAGPVNMDVFGGFVPVPMVVPGEVYGKKRPWFYNEF